MSDDPKTSEPPWCLGIITKRISFDYTNWRGERATRFAEPVSIWFGYTEWHPEPQWIMRATDTERGVVRDFAMKDMEDVRYES